MAIDSTLPGVVAITGGAGHIGRAIARSCAEVGATVLLIDREADVAEAAASELRAEGATVSGLALDLSDAKAIDGAAETVEATFSRLDGLVHNAAFYDSTEGWGVPFAEEGYDAWLDVMRVNLLAPFFLTQKLAPLLSRSPTASVVMISSIYGVLGPDNRVYEGTSMVCPGAYAASKGGLIQLTRWLSTTLAPKVRVNSVAPGGIARGQPESFVDAYSSRVPLGRMGVESEIAGAVRYLLSADSAYVTGQNIMVDGGLTAW